MLWPFVALALATFFFACQYVRRSRPQTLADGTLQLRYRGGLWIILGMTVVAAAWFGFHAYTAAPAAKPGSSLAAAIAMLAAIPVVLAETRTVVSIDDRGVTVRSIWRGENRIEFEELRDGGFNQLANWLWLQSDTGVLARVPMFVDGTPQLARILRQKGGDAGRLAARQFESFMAMALAPLPEAGSEELSEA